MPIWNVGLGSVDRATCSVPGTGVDTETFPTADSDFAKHSRAIPVSCVRLARSSIREFVPGIYSFHCSTNNGALARARRQAVPGGIAPAMGTICRTPWGELGSRV